jgi:Ca-activated chloride channel family protein
MLWHELFPWFLIPALALSIINYLPKIRLPLSTASFLTVTIVIAWLIQPSPAQASDAGVLQQAYTSWLNHDYSAAARYYARLDGYSARMGEGASCFRDEQLECAITAFSRAAWEATTDTQRGQAAFNLGNSYFKQGDFKSAITLYQDALRYQPQETAYQNNLDFSEEVQRDIERYLQHKGIHNTAVRHGGDQKEVDIDNRRVSDFNITPGDSPKNKQLKKSQRIELTKEQLAQYMQANLRFIRISSGHGEHKISRHDWSRFSNGNPVAARKIEYWQRLFELEEGIPAHPETPETLPGVEPW